MCPQPCPDDVASLLLSALAPASVRGANVAAAVALDDTTAHVTLTTPAGTTRVTGDLAALAEQLDQLVRLGLAAATTRAALTAAVEERTEEQDAAARAAIVAKYAHLTPELFALAAAPDDPTTWTVAGSPTDLRVRPLPRRRADGHGPAAELEVAVAGVVLGTVRVSDTEDVTTGPASGGISWGRSRDSQRLRALYDASPWRTFTAPPADAGVRAHVCALAAVAPVAVPWARLVEDQLARDTVEEKRRKAERVAWRTLCRSDRRIRVQDLSRWASGWSHGPNNPHQPAKVVSEPVVSRLRPKHLDGDRDRGVPATGAAEVVYVTRLRLVDPFDRRVRSRSRFTPEMVEDLVSTLPGCVVLTSVDRSTLLVAVDEPRFVQVARDQVAAEDPQR